MTLLKEEYVKLQAHCSELERKYALAAAAAGDINENSFVSRLLHTVSGLYDQQLYRFDTVICMSTQPISYDFKLV